MNSDFANAGAAPMIMTINVISDNATPFSYMEADKDESEYARWQSQDAPSFPRPLCVALPPKQPCRQTTAGSTTTTRSSIASVEINNDKEEKEVVSPGYKKTLRMPFRGSFGKTFPARPPIRPNRQASASSARTMMQEVSSSAKPPMKPMRRTSAIAMAATMDDDNDMDDSHKSISLIESVPEETPQDIRLESSDAELVVNGEQEVLPQEEKEEEAMMRMPFRGSFGGKLPIKPLSKPSRQATPPDAPGDYFSGNDDNDIGSSQQSYDLSPMRPERQRTLHLSMDDIAIISVHDDSSSLTEKRAYRKPSWVQRWETPSSSSSSSQNSGTVSL